MFDSGRSSGDLRDEYGVLPPGDILKCVLALSGSEGDQDRDLLSRRFKRGKKLRGHTVGNLLIVMLEQHTGDFVEGIRALCEIMGVKEDLVLPITTSKATLTVLLEDGKYVHGEAEIDVPRGRRARIKDVLLIPHGNKKLRAYAPALREIRSADFIVVGPGDLYTSIYPNFLVPGVSDAVRRSKAKFVLVMNLMTKYGETDGYTARRFVGKIEETIQREIDVVLMNDRRPESKLTRKYKIQKAVFIEPDLGSCSRGKVVVTCDLADFSGGIVRHSGEKLGRVMKKIIHKVV